MAMSSGSRMGLLALCVEGTFVSPCKSTLRCDYIFTNVVLANGFENLEPPRNVTLPKPRIFEDEDGRQHKLLGACSGRKFEGTQIFSNNVMKTIVREL
jgi:hypothetical protein